MIDSSDCPGQGRCHGCAAWCDHCGNVGKSCDVNISNGEWCDCHCCPTCNKIGYIRDYQCEGCRVTDDMAIIETDMLRAAERGDQGRADRLAVQLSRYNVTLA